MENNSIFSDNAHEEQSHQQSISQYLSEIEGDIGAINSNLTRMGKQTEDGTSPLQEKGDNQNDARKYSSLNKTCYNAHVFRMEHDLEDLLHNYNLHCFKQKFESIVIDADGFDLEKELPPADEGSFAEVAEADVSSEAMEAGDMGDGEEASPLYDSAEYDTQMLEAKDEFAETLSSEAEVPAFICEAAGSSR